VRWWNNVRPEISGEFIYLCEKEKTYDARIPPEMLKESIEKVLKTCPTLSLVDKGIPTCLDKIKKLGFDIHLYTTISDQFAVPIIRNIIKHKIVYDR
jgi:hypothetical protein